MKRTVVALLLSLPALLCAAQSQPEPQCDRWPTNIAEGRLKKAGLLGNIDYTKTKAVQLASEKIGKSEDGEQLRREVYHITFHEENGDKVKVIAVNDAGEFECSMSAVEVFVVSRHLPSRVEADRMFKQIE
ncbi:hypothetical protein OKW50_005384 [Paraburkholderia youngii]|uniref:DUF4258 domain-containing protein n=1 Tax=Paraburkholderia youngii TaxID=2782701 RepID=A0ABX2NWR5_9BURK|nr:hypothetical protein [Paraburkholderia youngii]NUX58786.1 hypothetical protein [Paraburkholderia youngii]NVI08458.1 hypothetical protein [Paraburkholderia youngii]